MTALLAVPVLLLGWSCTADPGPPADPEEALVETLQKTLDDSFAYRLVAEADREALEALGRSLGSVADRLDLFEVTGVAGGDTVSVDVQVFGTEPLFQLRRFDDDAVYVRVAAGDGPLAALATPELEGRLLGMAVQTDQPESVVGAIGALFDGSWIAVTGAFDPAALTGLGDPGPGGAGDGGAGDAGADTTAPTDVGGARTPMPEVVADHLAVTDRTEDDGTTTMRVELRVRALLGALAAVGDGMDRAGLQDDLEALPETVTGHVVTRDGVVDAIVFDVAAGAREAGEDVPGSLELRLELSEHGRPRLPPVPEALVTVPSAELTTGLAQLLTTPPPAPAGSASPDAP